jgi:hypothetical protein
MKVCAPPQVGAWHFDKRAWSGRPVDRHLRMPPDSEFLPTGALAWQTRWCTTALAIPNFVQWALSVILASMPRQQFHRCAACPAETKNDLVRKLIDAINEATDTIPGWNDYINTHVAKQLWDGRTFGKSKIAVSEMKDAR